MSSEWHLFIPSGGNSANPGDDWIPPGMVSRNIAELSVGRTTRAACSGWSRLQVITVMACCSVRSYAYVLVLFARALKVLPALCASLAVCIDCVRGHRRVFQDMLRRQHIIA